MFDDIKSIFTSRSFNYRLKQIKHKKSEEKIMRAEYRRLRSFTPIKKLLYSKGMIALYIFFGIEVLNLLVLLFVKFYPTPVSLKDANILIRVIRFLGDFVFLIIYFVIALMKEYLWACIIFSLLCVFVFIKLTAVFLKWKNQDRAMKIVLEKICRKCGCFSVVRIDEVLVNESECVASETEFQPVVTTSARTGHVISETYVPVQDVYTKVTQHIRDEYCCKRCGDRFAMQRVLTFRR